MKKFQVQLKRVSYHQYDVLAETQDQATRIALGFEGDVDDFQETDMDACDPQEFVEDVKEITFYGVLPVGVLAEIIGETSFLQTEFNVIKKFGSQDEAMGFIAGVEYVNDSNMVVKDGPFDVHDNWYVLLADRDEPFLETE
jgi:hypothetical protein